MPPWEVVPKRFPFASRLTPAVGNMPSAGTVSPSKLTNVVRVPLLREYFHTVPQQELDAEECPPPWFVVPYRLPLPS